MIEHLKNFKGLVNQLAKIWMKLDDKLQALPLLSLLPVNWGTLVVTLSNSTIAGKLPMDTMADSISNEEARRNEGDITVQSEANFVDNHGRSENRGRNRRRDKYRGRFKSCPKLVLLLLWQTKS